MGSPTSANLKNDHEFIIKEYTIVESRVHLTHFSYYTFLPTIKTL